jgi:hypothetical protein
LAITISRIEHSEGHCAFRAQLLESSYLSVPRERSARAGELIAFGLVWDTLEWFASHRMLRSSQTSSLRAILNVHLFQTTA